MKNITLNVKGMHCHSCEIIIKETLEDEKGIDNVVASEKDQNVKISFNDLVINVKKIKKIIQNEGYVVE